MKKSKIVLWGLLVFFLASAFVFAKGSYKQVTCPTCGGYGRIGCNVCNGYGKVTNDKGKYVSCTRCGGDGKLRCTDCGGDGKTRQWVEE